jgi:hypothetical protein
LKYQSVQSAFGELYMMVGHRQPATHEEMPSGSAFYLMISTDSSRAT